jgi:hypothetical protein
MNIFGRKGKKPLGRFKADGRIILECLKEIWQEDVDWIRLAQDSDQ